MRSYDVYPTSPTYNQCFTSYSRVSGTYISNWYKGKSTDTTPWTQENGAIYHDSTVTMAMITDGTSNTFLFSEKSHFQLMQVDPAYAYSDGSWNSANYYDTLMATFYPPNVKYQSGFAGGQAGYNYYFPTSASSQHPGGVNMAFCDGSVRFVKNTVNCWTYNSGNKTTYGDTLPDNITLNTSTFAVTNNGARLGVWQALSTRNGAEVISSDAY